MSETKRIPPSASVLIESMRDIGYSLDSAIADIIDNSIAAKAKNIKIFADTTGDTPCIAVIDDGSGMDQEALFEAMKPGSRSPREERAAHDLGRFGLGLKTASFSQCRRLTVVTTIKRQASCACWDIDTVVEADDWLIEILENIISIPFADELGETGTLVLWQKIDRLLEIDNAHHRQNLVRLIDEAMGRLELVFHRFLSGEKGIPKIAISINNRPLKPFDPFVSKHAATQAQPLEKIPVSGKTIEVQAFTLPHHSKVTPSEWERNGGPEGYARNQGFYIYRARRLIIHGTWFGLARQKELTKLCRVRIDMPNNLDADWKVDVRKASASPPTVVRDRLRRIIEDICVPSKRVYRHRGRVLHDNNSLSVWQRQQRENEISYRVHQEHPVVAAFVTDLPSNLQSSFRQILELIEASIPIDMIFSDIGEAPDAMRTVEISDEALEQALLTMVTEFRHIVKFDDLKDMLQGVEPFKSNWTKVSPLLEKHSNGVP